NRFGYSNDGDSIDRVLFATKPLEPFKPPEQRDPSEDRGLFYALAYDRVADGDVRTFGDDLQGIASLVRYLDPRPAERRALALEALYMYRWERAFDTDLHVFGLRAQGDMMQFSAGLEAVHIGGGTREVAEALAPLEPGAPIRRQS